MNNHPSLTEMAWRKFCRHPLSVMALVVVALFVLVGIYAPLLASSKPLIVNYEGQWYFPLFRYLFYRDFFSKPLDIFYNILMFTFPFFVASIYVFRKDRKWLLLSLSFLITLQCLLFFIFLLDPLKNPSIQNQSPSKKGNSLFNDEIAHLNEYGKLNLVLHYHLYLEQKHKLEPYVEPYRKLISKTQNGEIIFPSLWNLNFGRYSADDSDMMEEIKWLEQQSQKIHTLVMPLLRPFHWEDDAGGDQTLNQLVDWPNLTRINRKDMVSALIFGTRISLSVGILAIALSLLIGVPIGAISGYFGGKTDLILYRFIEIWESMPTFFMLLMVVAFLQSKSIFLVIAVIALFGWTSFSRFVRGEFFRQKQLPYTEACHALGYSESRIIFFHILPNAIPPLITLIPFAMMAAISSEASLSFLGLGEEGSNSWGVLMDEGRSAFPSESYLLWPPALLLTLLLVSFALIGDSLRDALDPKS